MYNKVQAYSRVPQLEKGLLEARLKWADMAKELVVFSAKVKKVLKLEAYVVEL